MPYLRKVDRKSVRLAIKKTAATPCSGFRCRDPSAVPLWLPEAAGDRIAPVPTRFFRFSRLQTASSRLPAQRHPHRRIFMRRSSPKDRFYELDLNEHNHS